MSAANRKNQTERSKHLFLSHLPDQKIIGLTGTIGSGKSTVAKLLAQTYPVIDCDAVNARLLEPGQKGFEQLKTLDYIALKDGKIDKQHMANKIFCDPKKKREVESLLHPLIFEEVNTWVGRQNAKILFVEMPILFEIGAQSCFDEIWCVVCNEQTAIERLMKYRNFSYEQAKMRIENQWSQDQKRAQSTIVIDNSGSFDQLKRTVLHYEERLR